MKVYGIGVYNHYRERFKSARTQEKTFAAVEPPLTKPLFYPHPNFTVSFLGLPRGDLKFSVLRHVPCARCGQDMIPVRIMDSINFHNKPISKSILEFLENANHQKNIFSKTERDFIKRLKTQQELKLTTPLKLACEKLNITIPESLNKFVYKEILPEKVHQKRLFDILNQYKGYLRPLEVDIYNEILQVKASKPDLTLQEVMVELRPKHLSKLMNKQLNVFEKIETSADDLEADKKVNVLKLLKKNKKQVSSSSYFQKFKRKDFLTDLHFELMDEAQNPIERKMRQFILDKSSYEQSSSNYINTLSDLALKFGEKNKATGEKVLKIVEEMNKMMFTDLRIPRIQKLFVIKINEVINKAPKNPIYEKVFVEASKLPMAYSDIDAFVVKYSGTSESSIKELGSKYKKDLPQTNNHPNKNILDELDTMGQYATSSQRLLLKDLSKIIKARINMSGGYIDKNWLIKTINEIGGKSSEKKILEKLIKKIDRKQIKIFVAPTAPNIRKPEGRSSGEVAEALLRKSLLTKEHLMPASIGGPSDAANYLLECSYCNGLRGNMPFDSWVRMNPQMHSNAQKFLDFVINLINNGKYQEYHEYPSIISETAATESKGLLVLNYDKLKDLESIKKDSIVLV